MRVYSFGSCDGFPDKLEAPAFLIEEGKERILVDCPPHINLLLREIGLSPMDLTGIFITHLHNDHVGGLIELMQLRIMCFLNQAMMKRSGYFTKIAVKCLPIYMPSDRGFPYERCLDDDLFGIITYNITPLLNSSITLLLDSDDIERRSLYHRFPNIGKESMQFNGVEIAWRCTKHGNGSGYGYKFGDEIAISGDTMFDEAHLEWMKPAKLKFHELGFGGKHTKLDEIEKVKAALGEETLFYHVPFPVQPMILAKGYRLAEKRWHEVGGGTNRANKPNEAGSNEKYDR